MYRCSYTLRDLHTVYISYVYMYYVLFVSNFLSGKPHSIFRTVNGSLNSEYGLQAVDYEG